VCSAESRKTRRSLLTTHQNIRANIDRKPLEAFSEFMDNCSEEKYLLENVFEIRQACYLVGSEDIPLVSAFEHETSHDI